MELLLGHNGQKKRAKNSPVIWFRAGGIKSGEDEAVHGEAGPMRNSGVLYEAVNSMLP